MTTSVLLLILSEAVCAQSPPPQEDFECRQSGTSKNGTRVLTGVGSVIIRTVPANELRQTCEVSVRDRSGKTIFEDRGFNIRIDPATGRDIDNR